MSFDQGSPNLTVCIALTLIFTLNISESKHQLLNTREIWLWNLETSTETQNYTELHPYLVVCKSIIIGTSGWLVCSGLMSLLRARQ